MIAFAAQIVRLDLAEPLFDVEEGKMTFLQLEPGDMQSSVVINAGGAHFNLSDVYELVFPSAVKA